MCVEVIVCNISVVFLHTVYKQPVRTSVIFVLIYFLVLVLVLVFQLFFSFSFVPVLSNLLMICLNTVHR